MNIFASYPDPFLSGMLLDDVRANKMIVESAQILSTALRKNGFESDDLYKPTHENHPCVLWASELRANYDWLMAHWFTLMARFKIHRDKPHACERLIRPIADNHTLLPSGDFDGFVNCTEYKRLPLHIAYRLTLLNKWRDDTIKVTWLGKTHMHNTWTQVEDPLLEDAHDVMDTMNEIIRLWTPEDMRDERNTNNESFQIESDS